MNIVCSGRQRQKSPTHTLGLTRNSINVRCRAEEGISRGMSHAGVRGQLRQSTLSFVTLPKSRPNGRNAAFSIVLRNGLKASGENVLLHAVRTEHESEKFIVKSLKLMGELMTIVYCISFMARVGFFSQPHSSIILLSTIYFFLVQCCECG